jgi:hypothetical protein
MRPNLLGNGFFITCTLLINPLLISFIDERNELLILFQFSLILIVCFPEHVLIFLALVDQLPNLTF